MRTLVLVALAAALVAACSTNGALAATPGSPGRAAIDLTVFAAASLAGVLNKVKPAYESTHAGTTLTMSTDSSAALEAKIEQGAPADLAKPGVKVIAAGDEVPITKYALQLVDNLAREPGYPADFAAAYGRNVVSKEDNVKAVIGKVELGEGDAAIVYATDAKASTKVTTVDIPEGANVPASYAGAVIGASSHQEAAKAFLGWLTSPDGQAVLSSFGFLAPPE